MTQVAEDSELSLIFPPEQSMSGRNATYFFCHRRQQQVNYAVCLHTVSAIEEERIAGSTFEDCQRAFCHNDCQAKEMKAEEVAAGQALYFKARITPVHVKAPTTDGAVSTGKYDMNDPSYARGWAIGGREGYSTDPKPSARKPVKKNHFVEASMADVVTAIAKESAAKPAEPVAVQEAATPSSTPLRPEPGESPLAFAKRRAQHLKDSQQ